MLNSEFLQLHLLLLNYITINPTHMKKLLLLTAVIVWVITPMFTIAQNNALDFDGTGLWLEKIV